MIRLDRRLFTATTYPADYGFVPDTLAGDGDPLDVLVLVADPTFPGCVVRVRILGVFFMRDGRGVDAKLIGVLEHDPAMGRRSDIEDVPEHLRNEIAHFFSIYKDLEPEKSAEVQGFDGPRRRARPNSRRAGRPTRLHEAWTGRHRHDASQSTGKGNRCHIHARRCTRPSTATRSCDGASTRAWSPTPSARWPDFYTEDAVYIDGAWGRIEGKEAIAHWLVDSMLGMEDWKFPVEFTAIEGNDIVVKWTQIMPRHQARWDAVPAVGVLAADLCRATGSSPTRRTRTTWPTSSRTSKRAGGSRGGR